MTNSSIPAESLDSPSPVSTSFLWEVPNKGFSVQISLDVIDRVEREVIDSFKAVTKRGSEVGGILLGRIARSGKRTVFVENFESVPCDYARGPLYLLAEPDKQRLRETLARLKGSPLSPVGFFRGNTRKELVLDDEDLALAEEFFPDPNQVFLLIKPFAMRPSQAGFFFREDGKFHTESYLQFPFRRSELQKVQPGAIVQAGGRAGDAGPAREDRAPVVFPKREEREAAGPSPVFPKREEPRLGPVVVPRREEPAAKREDAAQPSVKAPAPPPIIPRREEPLKPPPISPVLPKREERPSAPSLSFKRDDRPPVTPAAKREEKPARPPIAPVSLKRDEKRAAKQEEPVKRDVVPDVKPVTRQKEEAAPAQAAEQKTAEAPPPARHTSLGLSAAAAEDEAVALPLAPEPAKRKTGLWVSIAAAILLIAGGGAYYSFRGKPAPPPPDAGLNLRVERNAGQLVLSWNRNAPVIANAQTSTLSITDGEHTEPVELDLGTLRSGNVVYSPITNDVHFRLEVTGPEGTAVGESVRALAGRPSPLMQEVPAKPGTPEAKTQPVAATPPPAAAPKPAASAPAETPAVAAAEQTPPAPASESETPRPRVTLIPPRPDSLAARLRAAEPAELAAPPVIAAGQGSITFRALPGQTLAAPPPPEPAKPEVRVGGRVEEAVLVSSVPPVYPALARQAGVTGVVRVSATIGTDGTVTRAVAVSGPPLLQQAAQDAVRRWRYRPARLNGQPVEVTTQVEVAFRR